MRGHVDAESLALDAEGLLSRRQSARVRSHLAGCPECAATRQQLTEVTALLGQVPAAPLPPATAARLDLALSAEAARRAAEPTAAGATGRPMAARPPRQRTPHHQPVRHRPMPPATAPPATPRAPARPLQAARGGRLTAGTAGPAGDPPLGTALPRHAAAGERGRRGRGPGGGRIRPVPAVLRLVRLHLRRIRRRAAPATALPVYTSGLSYQPATLSRQAATALAEISPPGGPAHPGHGRHPGWPRPGQQPRQRRRGGGPRSAARPRGTAWTAWLR